MNKNKIIIFLSLLSLLISFNQSFAQDEEPVQFPKEIQSLIDGNPENVTADQLKKMLPMSITLDYTPNPVSATSPVKVTAQAVSSTGSNGINYRWFLDGQEKKSSNSVFEFNMNEDLVRQDLRCGDYREVKAEATNTNTKEKTITTLKIPIGLDLSFNKRAIGVADQNNPNTIDFNLNKTDISSESIALQVPDIFLKPTSSQNQFRYSDIVQVEAVDLRNTYNNQGCNTVANYTDLDSYLNSLVYQWTYNGTSQQGKSGKGQKFKTASFVINTLPAQTIQNDLAACNASQAQNNNLVGLTITDSSGKTLATKEESLNVIAPQINIKPICGAFGKDIQCITLNSTNLKSSYGIAQSYQLNTNQEVNFRASLGNFQPSQKLDIIWKVDGQEIDNKTVENPNTPYFTSPNIKMGNQIKIVEVTAINQVYNSNQTENATQKIILTPSQERAQIATTGTLGSLQKFLPNNFRNFYNFIAAAGLLGIIILLITIKEKKKNG
ncbi:MAG: hypothetical protein PHN19_04115 [Patescibacteria group bacterium]|nr:hypothetical protein [Patescibacteria group bacterium]